MSLDIPIETFNPDSVNAKTIQRFFLNLCDAGNREGLGIPLLIAKGAQAGKTLVIFAGVHGDELEGVQAVHEVFANLNVESLAGTLIAVSAANLPAYRVNRRISPIDSLNLARTFPGRKDGTVTERIAHYLSTKVLPHADFFIDLHSSGLTYVLPTMIGYYASDTPEGQLSRDAALRFGTPVMWGHAEISPGRSLCVAIEKRIPWLYVESPSGGQVSATQLPYYVNGVFNLLKYLKMVPGVAELRPPDVHLIGTGDLDRTTAVNQEGFFVAKVRVLDTVQPNQLIGIVRNVFGETIEEVRVEHGGVVGMLRAIPQVTPGDSVCLVVDSGPSLS